jgi:hypothetical protein
VEGYSYILLMARSDRSDITINTALAGTGGSNNRRKKTNAQKKVKRSYARWLMAYVATYGMDIANSGFQDFLDISDLILNKEADYLNPQKPLSELNQLIRVVQREKNQWPYDIEEHPLSDSFLVGSPDRESGVAGFPCFSIGVECSFLSHADRRKRGRRLGGG